MPWALFLVAISAAQAQDSALEREVRWRPVTELTESDFQQLHLDGRLVGPEGVLLLERQRARFNPLISMRTDFDREMIASLRTVR